MRVVVISKHGPPEVLRVEERPDPPVVPGEVRIAVKAAGINFADTMARNGTYPDAPATPCVVGYEVAGEVDQVGEGVKDFAVGDRVVAGTRFGGYAEKVSVHHDQVLPLAADLSFEQGASIPVNYSTAYAGLVIMGGLREGDRVLIHAAAGGVGIAATQIARNIGAQIFGTASAGKHDAIREQGVEHAIDYRNADFAEEIKRITKGGGVDVVMDAIGPTSFRKSYRSLRSGGRLIMFGGSEISTGESRDLKAVAKAVTSMYRSSMPWWKGLAIMNENKGVFGLNMLKWWDKEGSLDRALDPLAADFEAGKLKPVVAEAFPFDKAADAHRFLGEGKNIGKVVLVP